MLRRYLRAFWGAFRMTLRGETFTPPAPIPPSLLTLWINQYGVLVNDVLRTATHNGVDADARKAIKLRLDGRLVSLETALMTLRFHAVEEYPALVRQGVGRGVKITLYATNMNDRYWIARMIETPELQKPLVQQALAMLDAHLDGIPNLD